ncbi:MAG: hypothetical protein RLZZ387_815, partial [Chloroflexota bacterium]
SLLAEPIWSTYGIGVNTLVGAVTIGAAVLLLLLVRERE